jgi:hypothetical protein
VFALSIGTVIAKRVQLADELPTRARNERGHQPLVVLSACGDIVEAHSVNVREPVLPFEDMNGDPPIERLNELLACLFD